MTDHEDLIERLRKAFANPVGEPVELPPHIPLKPGQTQVTFLQKKKKDISDSSKQN